MMEKSKTMKLNKWFPAFIFGIFVLGSVFVVLIVNNQMRKQALTEAELKSMVRLDQNLAIHTYFSKQLKPKLFEWSAPFRTDDYFEPTWMSSTYAVREIEKYFESLNDEPLYYKECAIDARSPENEADRYEKLFLERLEKDSELDYDHEVRTIDGQPYYVTLRRGEVMEESCLRCHSEPGEAPKEMVDIYGPERSFHRKVDDVVQAISIRIPLVEAYKNMEAFSRRLSFILLGGLAVICAAAFFFTRHFVFKPIDRVRDISHKIISGDEPFGKKIPLPYWHELRQLTDAFNRMSETVQKSMMTLESAVHDRTFELEQANALLKQEMEIRKQQEEIIQEKAFLLDASSAIIGTCDLDSRMTFANPAFLNHLGFDSLSEILGRPFSEFWMVQEHLEEIMTALLGDGAPGKWSGELKVKRKDGSFLDTHVFAVTVLDSSGKPRTLMSTSIDITKRVQAEEQIKTSLKEKEVLLREIHHRVKNNLQVIVSLLKLQSDRMENAQLQDILKDSQDRVKSMSLVHEKLYQTENLSNIDFSEYIKSLTQNLSQTYATRLDKISFKLDALDISMEIDTAIPCGLIINELVSNSLKYAFPQDKEGEIKVAVRSISEDVFELDVSDNGIGIPEAIDFRDTKTLGLHLVKMLAEYQLDGAIELTRTHGTGFRIKFKRQKHNART